MAGSWYNVGEWTGTMYGSARFDNEYDITINTVSVGEHAEFGSPDLYFANAATDQNAYLNLTLVASNYPHFSAEKIVSTNYLDYSTAFGEINPTHWYASFRLPEIPEISHPVYDFKVTLSGDTWKLLPRSHLTGSFAAKVVLDARQLS